MRRLLTGLKWILGTGIGLLFLSLLAVLVLNVWVLWIGNRHLNPDPASLPHGSTAVVLGTSPFTGRTRAPNPFFEGRMNTAAALYHAGILSHLVLSGDNRKADYNEPYAMRDALRQRGVPPSAITLDYAGFRTLDSIIRAQRVFEIQHPVIITDDFHIARALFLADTAGLDAVGVASERVLWRRSYKTRVREWGSRVRAWADVYLLKTQPHFLGKTIQIPNPSPVNLDESPEAPQTPHSPAGETLPPEAPSENPVSKPPRNSPTPPVPAHSP